MRLSINVGYDHDTIIQVSEFMRVLEGTIATTSDVVPTFMGCKDDAGNTGISIIFVPKTAPEEANTEETTDEENTGTDDSPVPVAE